MKACREKLSSKVIPPPNVKLPTFLFQLCHCRRELVLLKLESVTLSCLIFVTVKKKNAV